FFSEESGNILKFLIIFGGGQVITVLFFKRPLISLILKQVFAVIENEDIAVVGQAIPGVAEAAIAFSAIHRQVILQIGFIHILINVRIQRFQHPGGLKINQPGGSEGNHVVSAAAG